MKMRRITSWLKGRFADPILWSGQSDDMVCLHGPDGRFVKISESARSVTGHVATGLEGLTLRDITAPGDPGLALEALARATCLGQQGRAEFQIKRADGTISWAEMTTSVGYDGSVRSIIRDIAARRAGMDAESAARRKAEQEASLKSDYLADLSHEIRTPLGALIGFADAMKAETFGPLGSAKYSEYAGLIHKSGEHLLDLVSGLLDLSKIEAQRYEIHPEPVDLVELVEDCVGIIGVSAREAGLDLSTDSQLDQLVAVDPRTIKQILLNLLSNAVKFTEHGGIRVKLRHDPHNIWISVTDTGVGMSAAQLARVGQRFRQAHKEGVRGDKGTGLGLALCDGLARVHDGDLRLTSVEGEGSTATLRLPFRPVAQKSDMADNPVSVLERVQLRRAG